MNKSILFSYFLIFLLPFSIRSQFQCDQDGFFPDKYDCRLYHICADGIHTIKTCKDELLFNPLKNECDWAINVNCTSSSIDINRKSPLDILCQSVDNDYIAHPTDCKQYAYCANGVPQTKLCKKTLLWSQAEKMCVWPAQSDCPARTSTTTTSTTTTTTITTTISTTQFITQSQLLNFSGICPPTVSKRLPDPYDCTMYHDCYQGIDLVSYCPNQYQYNHEKQTCDHSQNVQCKNKCTFDNSGSRFVDPLSCCHFYECINGKIRLQTCPQTSFYDIKLRKCLPANQVQCNERRKCLTKCHYLFHQSTNKNLCEPSTLCKGHSDGFYLDSNKPNCQSYIQCLNQRLINSSRCPIDQRFNKNLGQCTSSDQVPCSTIKINSFSKLFILFFVLEIKIYLNY